MKTRVSDNPGFQIIKNPGFLKTRDFQIIKNPGFFENPGFLKTRVSDNPGFQIIKERRKKGKTHGF